MLNLNEIMAACEALDDRLGPQGWRLEGPDYYGLYSVYDGDGNRFLTTVEEKARFIAHARTWVPALVEELREARATIDYLQVRIAALGQQTEYDEWEKHDTQTQRARTEIELRALVPSPELLRRLAEWAEEAVLDGGSCLGEDMGMSSYVGEHPGHRNDIPQALALARRIEEAQAND